MKEGNLQIHLHLFDGRQHKAGENRTFGDLNTCAMKGHGREQVQSC